MAESTLSLGIDQIAAEVGGYLGFSFTPSQWTGWNVAQPYVPISVVINGQTVGANDTQTGWVRHCLDSGLRQAYRPPLSAPNEAVAHKWSFMTPETTLQIVASQTEYDLPDWFAAFEGDLYFQPTDFKFNSVQRTGIGDIRGKLQITNTLASAPRLVASVAKDSDGVMGQRWKAVFWPIPDKNYTLTYRYRLQPKALTWQNPYPLGGPDFGELVLCACLMVAESRRQDGGEKYKMEFKERLAAVIAADDRENQPEMLGYNADRSSFPGDQSPYGPWRHGWSQEPFTINGIQPG